MKHITFRDNWKNCLLVSKKFHDYFVEFSNISGLKDKLSLIIEEPTIPRLFISTNYIKLFIKNRSCPIQQFFLHVCKLGKDTPPNIGYIDILTLLLKDFRVDPSHSDNYAIRQSSSHGHFPFVQLLLQDPRVDPSDQDNFAIKTAMYCRYYDIILLLIQDPRVGPSVCNYAIEQASSDGKIDFLRQYIKHSRVKITERTIFNAVLNGHIEIVKLLLKDPRVIEKNYKLKQSLEAAQDFGNKELVKLLQNY